MNVPALGLPLLFGLVACSLNLVAKGIQTLGELELLSSHLFWWSWPMCFLIFCTIHHHVSETQEAFGECCNVHCLGLFTTYISFFPGWSVAVQCVLLAWIAARSV